MSQINTNAILDASGGTTATVNGFAPTASNMAGRNRIINGNMRVAQRGTSFTAQGYTLDRWYQLLSGGTATVTQETFPLGSEVSGCSNYLKQATSVGNDYCGLIYKVEDVKSLAQGTATISFYAKGTNPAAGSFQLVIYRMHDGSTVHDTLLDTTITVTTSWQRFTHSFTVPTLAGMSTPTANSLIYISLRQADNDTSTAAWELNLTGVQLEEGSVATPFEHRQYGQEEMLCKRYYQTFYSSNYPAFHYSTSVYTGVILPVTMRTSPTITSNGQGTNYYEAGGAYSFSVSSYSGDNPSTVTLQGYVTGGTNGYAGTFSPTFQASAEL